MNAEPGTIEEVEEGAELLNWDPSYPHAEYEPFIRRSLQGIASGLLVSYGSLANDRADSSFSAERSAKLTERDTWQALQRWLTDWFVEHVFTDWLPWSLAAGQVKSGGRTYGPRDFERLSRGHFAARPFPWATNPLQEVGAAALEVDKGFRSRDDVIVQAYGQEPGDVDEEIAASQKRAEEKGIQLSGPGTVSISVADNGGQK